MTGEKLSPISVSPNGSILLGVVALLVLLGGFGVWSIKARIAGAVVAQGHVEVESHPQIVQHLEGGIVDEIRVTDGEVVSAGDILIRLNGDVLRSELAVVEDQYYEVLVRRGRLEALRAGGSELVMSPELVAAIEKDADALKPKLDGQIDLLKVSTHSFHELEEQLRFQIDQIEAQVQGLDAQMEATSRQRALMTDELKVQLALRAKGLTAASTISILQREAARIDGTLGELRSSRAQAWGKVAELNSVRTQARDNQHKKADEDLNDIAIRELELKERRRMLHLQISGLDVRAPVNGIVHDLRLTTAKSVLRPADAILFLIPDDVPFVVTANLDPRDVDEVRVGQSVELRFAAVSSRDAPNISGVVERLSADAILDEITRMPFYTAQILITDAEIARLGSLKLKSGMPVDVFIETGLRSPLAYLVEPLTAYFVGAFRES